MSNEVTKAAEANNLPAHLQGGKKAKFGNIDQSDLIIPRVKLLQATSEEVTTFDGAKIGQFWHTIAQECLGDKVRIVPLVMRKSLALWAPRGDDRGILARSSNLVDWDEGYANLEFDIKLKDVKEKIVYKTLGNVAESGLANFGSLNPNNPDSRPAASLTYNLLFYFPDFHEYSPAVVINTRSSIRAAKGLISKIELRPVDHYDQMFVMGTTDEKGDEGPYKGYSYTADGFTTPEMHEITEAMYNRFEPVEWRSNDEGDEAPASGGGGAGAGGNVGGTTGNKF